MGERAAVPKCLSNLQLKLMSAPCARDRPACSHICCLQRGVAPRLLRAGMTSVGVGRVIRYCIVHVGGVLSVCARPLACCCKNVFRQKGVRVDTVAVSLFLASVWNSLVQGKERGRWAGSPSGNVSCCLWGGGKKYPIGYSCYVAPGEPHPLCCPGCLI